ncbi:hypothetical protein LJR290_007939 [Variovorax sp. LjRoot290]|uniref:hypothetical protein n=1 Tax=Variovorax sp. LjRoot290 TaxID=3342316 RepID=UPI003ECCABC6
MNTPKNPADRASGLEAVQLMARVRAATTRRAGDERRFTKALTRQRPNHLSADEAVQLARNMGAILEKRKAQIGRRPGELCREAFKKATSSRELYRLRLAEGEDPDKKQLRRSFERYKDLAEAVATMTGEPQTKALRELVAGTRFDQLQAKMAEWDRIDAVADLLQDLVDRLNEEFGWSALYRRTVDVRLASGGTLTWPLEPNKYHEASPFEVAAGETESFERKLRASVDPASMYYAPRSEIAAASSITRQYFDNDQLQDERFFFVPHARVGYLAAWDLPKRSEEPLRYHVMRAEAIAWERQEPDGMKEPEIGWDAERQEPKGHVDGGARIYCGSTTQSYAWLIAYPSPLNHGTIVPALYRPGEDTGAWLMPLDRSTLAAVEDGIWLDRESDSTLLERLEVLLGADQTDGMCPLERDLRLTGSWLAFNPVLTWESRQRERHRNMLDRARS